MPRRLLGEYLLQRIEAGEVRVTGRGALKKTIIYKSDENPRNPTDFELACALLSGRI